MNSVKLRKRCSRVVTMTTTTALNIHWRVKAGTMREEKLQSTYRIARFAYAERNMQFLIKILFRMVKSFSADIWFSAWRCVNDRKLIACAPVPGIWAHEKPFFSRFSPLKGRDAHQKCWNGLKTRIFPGCACAKREADKIEAWINNLSTILMVESGNTMGWPLHVRSTSVCQLQTGAAAPVEHTIISHN